MATIKGDPAAQVAYLAKKADALRRKTSSGPVNKTKRGVKDHANAQLAEKIVSKRSETAARRAAEMGITARPKPAKAAEAKQ